MSASQPAKLVLGVLMVGLVISLPTPLVGRRPHTELVSPELALRIAFLITGCGCLANSVTERLRWRWRVLAAIVLMATLLVGFALGGRLIIDTTGAEAIVQGLPVTRIGPI